MLESIRRTIVWPRVNLEGVATVATVVAFFWLLAQGAIQPIAVFLLEIYLSF